MFVNLSIHYPKPEFEQDLIDSMHRFGAAAAGAPGLLHAMTTKDETTGRLVGLMVWTSREAWEAAIERSRAAVAGDDFDLWEEGRPEGFRLGEV
jgi:heme-degrading monooxygenase HmoA